MQPDAANEGLDRDSLPSPSLLKRIPDRAIGETVRFRGWVRTSRKMKKASFVQVCDGSNMHGVQVVLSPDLAEKRYGVLVMECLREWQMTKVSIA